MAIKDPKKQVPVKSARCPCAKCGTTDGKLVLADRATCRRPARITLARFGLAGMACHACYMRFDRIAQKAKAGVPLRSDVAAWEKVIPPTLPQVIASRAKDVKDELWAACGQEGLLAKEARDDERRRSYARRAEIERAEIVRKRNRMNRVGLGVLRVASV